MTSACIFKDTLKNDTQVFLKFKVSVFEICSHFINFSFTPYFLTPSELSKNAGTTVEIPPDGKWFIVTSNTNHFLISTSLIQLLRQETISSFFKSKISRWPPITQWTHWTPTYSLWSNSRMRQAHNETTARIILTSTELSGTRTRGMPTISSVAFPEPDVVTLDDNSNDPTFPYGFWAQQPTVPPRLNDFYLPQNSSNILAAITVDQQNPTQHDENYGPLSPEPFDPSPISPPLINVRTFDSWETRHTTTDDNTF